ncbi:Protein of unknown function (DUF3095) [Fragilaria crotonensis]|nr:Protein of unknown function (DUF3095) [Fragilaria crotonensis]
MKSSHPNEDASETFYKHLTSFSDFSELTNDKHYVRVPLGWTVVITDVKGSTKAIDEGRYKDVNTIGVAGIAAVQNLLPGLEFPYVFGGDGATLLIPNRHIKAVSAELAALKNLSKKNFGLELRVGMVDISEVTAEYICVEVAKHELCAGKCIAVFRGGGLLVAEAKVKDEPETYEIPESTSRRVNLAGLTCRWKDIPNKRGRVISLLVMAGRNKGKQPYIQFFEKLKEIFSDVRDAHPVHPELMTYRTVEDCVEDEKRWCVRQPMAWLNRRLEISVAVKAFLTMKTVLGNDPVPYKAAMKFHTDHQKFDDMLRMVLDCSDDEASLLEQYLQNAHQRGDVYYGIHFSSTSRMTCFVQGLEDGNHIHFIDGGDGGFAIAAKQLKRQLRHTRQPSVPVTFADELATMVKNLRDTPKRRHSYDQVS